MQLLLLTPLAGLSATHDGHCSAPTDAAGSTELADMTNVAKKLLHLAAHNAPPP